MPDFDVEAFVARLDRMGLKLTSVPLADGKLRINRWRMLNAGEHTQQIHDLWAMQIGNNQERIDVLAAHLAKAAPQVTANRINPNRTRIGPMQSATATTMPAGSKIAAAQSTSTSLRASIGAPKPAGRASDGGPAQSGRSPKCNWSARGGWFAKGRRHAVIGWLAKSEVANPNRYFRAAELVASRMLRARRRL